MSDQEVYSQIRKHLLKQKKRCTGLVKDDIGHKPTGCKYHFKKLKCAAGCLISEQDYLPSMESYGVDQLDYFKSKYSDCLDLILSLQVCHDTIEPSKWKDKLDEIAKTFGLKAK